MTRAISTARRGYNALHQRLLAYARGGGIVADEAMNEALSWALNRMDAAGNPAPMVIGDLDPRNTAAARLLRRIGFQPVCRDTRRAVWTYEPGTLRFASA
jgi:RimJ/RimL family protein N-acetyltransferase